MSRSGVDESGRKYGELTVITRGETRRSNGELKWLCKCSCGREIEIRGSSLRSGNRTDCGHGGRKASRDRNYSRREDLTGRRFGNYTVLEFSGTQSTPSGGGNAKWLCRCDCGATKAIGASYLKYGKNQMCVTCSNRSRLEDNWWVKSLIKRYRANAVSRDLVFALDPESFRELIDGDCYYCGSPPSDIVRHSRNKDYEHVHNGIDRFVGSDGYTQENCVTCCWRCNRSKGGLSGSDFIDLCRIIAARHPA